MKQAALIDIFTTQNDLYGKNNCPIQFCCEIVSDDDMNDIEHLEKFMSPVKRKVFNIIPDEPIMMSGYNASGFRTEDTKTSDYNGHTLDVSMTAIRKILSSVEKSNVFLIGYNHINYDVRILNETMRRVLGTDPIPFNDDYVIDVMKFAESVIPIDEIGNYSMDSVFTYLENTHITLDAFRQNKSTVTELKKTKMIMRKLLHRIGKPMSFPDIVNFIRDYEKRQVKFTFGKYKGMDFHDVAEIDYGYLNWVVNNVELKKQRPHFVENIKAMLAEQE